MINSVINKIDLIENKVVVKGYIYIYGAGGYGKSLLKSLLKMNLKVCGFLDKYRNDEVDGYECVKLSDPKCDEIKNNADVVILIGIHNRETDPYQIKSELLELGFLNIYTPVEYYDELPNGVYNSYWLSNSDIYKKNIENISYAYEKMENKEVFIDILEYRLGFKNYLKYAKKYPQYRPTPILKDMVFCNFIDAGAYNGDTIKDFMAAGLNVTNYYAYEPNLKEYTELSNTLNKYEFKKYLFPAGLSDINGQVYFLCDGESGASVNVLNDGENFETVPVIRLDDSLQDVVIDFIKMDIEGLENKALLGSSKIINTQKPILAICVYHKPDDLWAIIKLIETICPNIYKFYLYQHELNTFEVVLYAMPK